MEFTERELEFLREALADYMGTDYDSDNSEGTWDAGDWEILKNLEMKLR